MAPSFCLNILLLLAGVVALASASTTSPAFTSHPSTVTEANVTLSVAPQNFTHTSPDHPPTQTLSSTIPTAAKEATASPTTTMASTTTTAPTTVTRASVMIPTSTPQNPAQPQFSNATRNDSTQPPQATKCFYTLQPIQFGFRINISNSARVQNYTLTLEDQTDKTSKSYSVTNAMFDLDGLKPCTKYRHELWFVSGNMNRFYCEQNGTSPMNQSITNSLNSADFEDVQNKQGCYRTKWNITATIFPPQFNQLCIKLNQSICTNVKETFQTNCGSSFTLSKFIVLESHNIEVKVEDQYPVNLSTTLPPNCKGWAVNYNCSEKGSRQSKSLSELEPYTNYTCAVEVTRQNVTQKRDTNVWIDCKLTSHEINSKTSITTDSVDLHWSLSSSVCRDNLSGFNFTYDCQCQPHHERKGIPASSEVPQEVSCHFSDLHAYTEYECWINVKYNSEEVHSTYRNVKTKPGRPEMPIVSVRIKDRNWIVVTWKGIEEAAFKGRDKIYIVRLFEGEALKKTQHLSQNNKKDTNAYTHVFEHLGYSTNYKVQLTTFNGVHESDSSSKSISTLYNESPLIGILVFLIILTCVALIFVTYKIYILRRERARDSSESMNLIPKTNDEDRLIFVEPITAESLLDAYKRKIADEGRLFLAEFQSIPRIFSKYTVKDAKKSHNVPKNRYVDILPYDYNRVQLTTGNGSAGCDYINASFIDGFKESKKYIAAQGPKEETVSDFWRMIWEQKASIIVMVSRCEEGNRVKCAQYWPSPDRDTEIFEEFIVKLTLEDVYPDYVIRHLSLTNKRDKGSEREVTHIQFMSWPDHGVPEEAHLLLKLRRRVNSFKNFFSGPIVIHCSAGVGRTGTYIGIDAMMESLEAEGTADIYNYVVMLRRQRCLMVQVEAQYILIHQALLEHTQFGETESPLQELHSTLNTLKQKSSDNELTLMEDEFDRLPSFKNWKTFNTGVTEENKKKNRTSSVIPYDYNRVLLKVNEGHSHESDPDDDDYEMSSDDDNEEAAKYINASLISGYWGPHDFLLAQTPLPDTVADFWAMVLQYKVSTVVMLSDCSHTDEDCLYLGEDKKTFEDIEVELESTDNCPGFTLRTMLIHHAKTKARQQVKHFQFLKWGNGELPEKPQDLIDLIREIEQRCSLTRPRSTPVVIHCNDGSSRSGVLCGLWNLLDSAKKEKTVDVFQVVKTLRKERLRMFSSLEQYQFLYEALEVTFPVQNGDVKAAQNSVQIVDETRAPEPCSTTSADQQGVEESADGDVAAATEEKEEDSKCPTVTVEV